MIWHILSTKCHSFFTACSTCSKIQRRITRRSITTLSNKKPALYRRPCSAEQNPGIRAVHAHIDRADRIYVIEGQATPLSYIFFYSYQIIFYSCQIIFYACEIKLELFFQILELFFGRVACPQIEYECHATSHSLLCTHERETRSGSIPCLRV